MTVIRFGTSGWRGVVAEDFTFENVKVVTQAIADYIRETGHQDRWFIVGYDTRFLSERFAQTAAEVLAGNSIRTMISKRDIPTPVISYEILQRSASGAINFTASHNPPEYNGLKFSPASGGPALPETTKRIEELAQNGMKEKQFKTIPFEEAVEKDLVREFDGRNTYLQRLRELVDLEVFRKAGLRLAFDPMYGTGREYLDTFLKESGVNVTVLHNYRDPYFGGLPPEPSEENLGALIRTVKDSDLALGLGTDGDADRFGIVDKGGHFVQPNMIIALLFDYLIRTRGWEGGAARSVATSHLIDRVADLHGREVFETPVGFKYIGELISQGKIVIGGEESAGLTIQGHIPEKDGILACLLTAEMVVREGKTVSHLLDELYKKVGTILTRRINLKLTPAIKENLAVKLAEPPSTFAGRKVKQVVTIDGTKLILSDESWVLMRPSGTEPVARLYIEAETESTLKTLSSAVKEYILK
jgi:phosphoglucomutase